MDAEEAGELVGGQVGAVDLDVAGEAVLLDAEVEDDGLDGPLLGRRLGGPRGVVAMLEGVLVGRRGADPQGGAAVGGAARRVGAADSPGAAG